MANLARVMRGHFRTVDSLGTSDKAHEIIRRSRAWAEDQLVAITAIQTGLQVRFAGGFSRWNTTPPASNEPYETPFTRASVHAMRVAAWLLLRLECAVSTGLMLMLTSLPTGAAIAVGCLLAITLALVAKACFAVSVARFEETPRLGREWLGRVVLVFGTAEGLFIAALLVMRGSAGEWALALVWAFGPILGVLGVLTPILGGLLFTAAHWVGWALELEAEWIANDRMARRLKELTELCSARLQDAEQRGPERTREYGAVAASLATCLLFLPPSATAADPVYQVFVDRSGSVSSEALAIALDAVNQQIVQSWDGRASKRWEFVTFADDAYVAREIARVELPAYSAVCPELAPEAMKLLRLVGQTAERKCHTRALAQVTAAVDDVKRRLMAATAPANACSAVYDLLLRISRLPANSVVYAVTDGVDTCGRPRNRISEPQVRSTILLLPTKRHKNLASDLEKRKAALQRIAPWLSVRMAWELGL